MRSPHLELTDLSYEDLGNEFYDPDTLAPWYIGVRAVEAFRDHNEGRYAGFTESDIESNFPSFRAEVDSILQKINPDGSNDSVKVDNKVVKELLRYSDSQLHTVSAFLGGVASQEAIKLLIKQYTPLNHTLIYDGIHGKCQTFNL